MYQWLPFATAGWLALVLVHCGSIIIRVLLSLLTSLSFVSSFYFTSLSFRTIHHRHPQFSIAPFNPLSAFLERNHVWSSATYHPLELASRTTCVVRSTCTGTMKKHAAAVSFIAPASTETAVVAGAGGATNVDGAAAGSWAHVSVITFY